MAPRKLFILALIVMVGLAYWNYQRSGAQQQALLEAGFVLSDELRGNPDILVSRSQKQFAVVFSDGYLRADFNQIAAVEVRYNALAEQDQNKNYRIRISLKGTDPDSVEVLYQNETLARQALQRLNLLLKD